MSSRLSARVRCDCNERLTGVHYVDVNTTEMPYA